MRQTIPDEEQMTRLNNLYMRGVDGIDPEEKIAVAPSDSDTSIHMHDFVEIVYFTQGVGTHCLGGRKYNVFPGCVCVMNRNEKHYYSADRDYCDCLRVTNVIFYPEFLGCTSDNFLREFTQKKLGLRLEDNITYFHLMSDQDREIDHCFQLIKKELSMKKQNYLEVVKSLLEAVLLLIISERSNRVESTKFNTSFIKIDESMAYLSKDIRQIPAMKHIARKYGFSPEYYSKLFREYTGKTYAQFTQELKCNEAGRLLRETDYTNECIAEMCGFSTQKQFYHQFKTVKGLTPKEYRLRNRK